MEIEILGAHNCESSSTGLTSLLVDNVIALDASALTSSLSFAAQKELRAVIITHHHYDHIRDIPALAMNLYLMKSSINIYASPVVIETVKSYLLNDVLYPKFHERPVQNPTIQFIPLAANEEYEIENYRILPVPVNHPVPTNGYQIISADGKTIFYTGDTGKGLAEAWRQVSPKLLVIELTASNRFEASIGGGSKHLTPRLLEQELHNFKQIKGYLPQVILVHMSPLIEPEITAEIELISHSLATPISLAYEGMKIKI